MFIEGWDSSSTLFTFWLCSMPGLPAYPKMVSFLPSLPVACMTSFLFALWVTNLYIYLHCIHFNSCSCNLLHRWCTEFFGRRDGIHFLTCSIPAYWCNLLSLSTKELHRLFILGTLCTDNVFPCRFDFLGEQHVGKVIGLQILDLPKWHFVHFVSPAKDSGIKIWAEIQKPS